MELPPYRMPTLKTTLKHMWNKGEEYLKKMGTIILVAVVLVWALTYFPRPAADSSYNRQLGELEKRLEQTTGEEEKNGITQQISLVKKEKEAATLENSYIGRLGKAITPVFRPLGFDWKMSVSLLAGVTAKEIVVSTMGVLYQSRDEKGTSSELLAQRLKDETFTEGPLAGEKVFTDTTVLAFLIFILVYFPCVATVTAIAREAGSWKWAALAIVYTTVLAWILAFLVRQAGLLFT
jgi:ferrous iron transport protein B